MGGGVRGGGGVRVRRGGGKEEGTVGWITR